MSEIYIDTNNEQNENVLGLGEANSGIAFGKVSESDEFDCALKAHFRDTVVFDDNVTFEKIPCTTLVDDIYITLNPENPATKWPGTTWQAFGAGRVLVGVNASDPDFNTPGKTGGAKTVTLTKAEMPAHTHTFYGRNSAGNVPSRSGLIDGGGDKIITSVGQCASVESSMVSTGNGLAHNNLQPYIAVYMWLRTS